MIQREIAVHGARRRRSRRWGGGVAGVLLCGVLAACAGQGSALPWPANASERRATHVDVATLNTDYHRTSSGVLVREVKRPRRAALDYAAYHENFMIDEPEPEERPQQGGDAKPDVSHPFEGWLDTSSMQADIEQVPLSDAERENAFAFPPLVEFLRQKKIAGAEDLEELGGKVRDESWGLQRTPGIATQMIGDLFVHEPAGKAPELWVKIEFQPWFKALGQLPDQDGDGFPEFYAKVKSEKVTPELVTAIRQDYGEAVLSPAEVKTWANQLASYWYPSFNTDLVPPGPVWPDERTEPEIKRELGERSYKSPTIVLRGKPRGKPTYNVFLVHSAAAAGAQTEARAHIELAKSRPSPNVDPIRKQIERELAEHGGKWETWAKSVAPLHGALKKRLKSAPAAVKAFAGEDGFLFFRNSLDYVVGGDLERQRAGKNPVPIIVEFKKALEKQGVDFLFVPVPTKLELFPDKLEPKQASLAGQVINPYSRKFLLSLANAGVEVVDLLTPFLAARRAGDPPGAEPLYQRQDTHWTARGLGLAAEILAARVKRYGWYAELAKHSEKFSTHPVDFTRFGDLHSRLPDAQKRNYQPEALKALQVLTANGAPYEDDPDSPVTVLGDSFTGVYELTDAEHAGVSAHLAKEIGYPTDLVMSYGGGPNVRNKLMRRGAAELARKKLVIWLMTARDLYNYWENWEHLDKK